MSLWKEFQIIVIPGESVTLFRHSEAERREMETTVTTGQCMPIILCALIAQTDLVEEQMWGMALVEQGEQRETTHFVKV